MKHFLHFIVIVLLATTCKGNKPGLSDKQLLSLNDSLLATIYPQADKPFDATTPPAAGIKYREASRGVNPAHPPVVFDLENRNLQYKNLDLANYYQRVHYIKLKHPQADEGKHLYGEGRFTNVEFLFNDDGDGYILFGSLLNGLHCYNLNGRFLRTIAEGYTGVTTERRGSVMMTILNYDNDKSGYFGQLSVFQNTYIFLTGEGNQGYQNVYSMAPQPLALPIESEQYNVNPDKYKAKIPYDMQHAFHVLQGISPWRSNTIIKDAYNIYDDDGTLLYSFAANGDTLCRFRSYNPVFVVRGDHYHVTNMGLFSMNDELYVQQPFNDTIFRIASVYSLEPAYIVRFGKYKLDKIGDMLYGEHPGKFHFEELQDAGGFVLCIYREERDTHLARKNGQVKFFYSFYDKTTRQLYHLPTTDEPENVFIQNSLPEGAPVLMAGYGIRSPHNMLHTMYTKGKLQAMIKAKAFTSLPLAQQEKVKSLHDELADGEILIMVVE